MTTLAGTEDNLLGAEQVALPSEPTISGGHGMWNATKIIDIFFFKSIEQ